MSKATTLPVMFVGHGNPMNAIQDNDFTRTLRRLGKSLPTPKAILCVSAHWETDGTSITQADYPRTIHDFYGFPEALFKVQYPAPGAPDLATDIAARTPPTKGDQGQWGLDHGTWSVLCHLFPDAQIPTLQLSLDRRAKPADHFAMGRQLRKLRNEGVLIIGSGNIVHNLRQMDWSTKAPPKDWAVEFDQWVKEHLENQNFSPLIESPRQSTAGQLSIPTWEHYLPLLYVLGAADETDTLSFPYEGIHHGSISMTTVSFEAPKSSS